MSLELVEAPLLHVLTSDGGRWPPSHKASGRGNILERGSLIPGFALFREHHQWQEELGVNWVAQRACPYDTGQGQTLVTSSISVTQFLCKMKLTILSLPSFFCLVLRHVLPLTKNLNRTKSLHCPWHKRSLPPATKSEIILFLPLLPEQKAGSLGVKWRQELIEGITLRSPYKPGAELKEDP